MTSLTQITRAVSDPGSDPVQVADDLEAYAEANPLEPETYERMVRQLALRIARLSQSYPLSAYAAREVLAIARLARARAVSDEGWKATVRRAVEGGVPVTIVAAAAGISRERVYQIRDGRY